MGTHKKTDKGTEYEDLSPGETFEGPGRAEIEATIAQLGATKHQFGVPGAPPLTPEALGVLIDSQVTVLRAVLSAKNWCGRMSPPT